MNNRLITYYNKELEYLREMGKEFAIHYPKIASRLNLNDNETPDPYVERLLEGVAFLTARTQLKIDAEYPQFIQRILEVVYPQFLYPTPASAIIKFDTSTHYNVDVISQLPRGAVLDSLPIEINAQSVSCQFSATQDTMLTPLTLEASTYTNALDYLPEKLGADTDVRQNLSALRLDFSIKSANRCSDLIPDSLSLYLGSNLPVSSQLLYLLMSETNSIICHSYEDAQNWHYVINDKPKQKGFHKDEALVFNLDKSIAPLRILQEYIQLPEKFLFIQQEGIKSALLKAEAAGKLNLTATQTEEVVAHNGINKRQVSHEKRRFSLSFLFNKHLPELVQLVKENDIAINAIPMVNLFRKKSIRFPVDMQNIEHHVVIDRVQPLNFEVHHIERARGFDKFNNQQVIFTPIYAANDQGVFTTQFQENAFFSVRRDARTPSTNVSLKGGRTSYLGSEVFISIMDERQSVFDSDIEQLSVDAWCTNRDLPLILPRSTESDFLIDNALPISAAHIASKMTKPITAITEEQSLWTLLNQLNLSYVSLVDYPQEHRTLLLKELLLTFPHNNNRLYESEVNSIKKFDIQPVTRLVRHKGAASLRKGIAITLLLDESLLAGVHPYLFSSVLRFYFSHSVSINSFIDMTVETVQQGEIASWDGLRGDGALL